MTMQNNNIATVAFDIAIHELGAISNDILFVGGSIVPLLFTSDSNYFRATLDVDCVINVEALVDYYGFVAKLKHQGFKEMMNDNEPICRLAKNDIVVDIMPTSNVIGFTNSWYLPAFNNPTIYHANGFSIRVISAVYFIATKLEAFQNRGKNDFMGSHDMEDIISVIECRAEIIDEISLADMDVKKFIVSQFKVFCENARFLNDIIGHCNPDSLDENNFAKVQTRIKQIASMKV